MPPLRKSTLSKPTLRKPTWQQATALVSLSTCGAMTGFAFAHGTVAEMTSPTRIPVKLMALDKPATPAKAEQTGDSALRSAIVKVATVLPAHGPVEEPGRDGGDDLGRQQRQRC